MQGIIDIFIEQFRRKVDKAGRYISDKVLKGSFIFQGFLEPFSNRLYCAGSSINRSVSAIE